MMSTPDNKCPLCGFALDALEVVSDDTTPYADRARRRYPRMMWWVLLAGNYRLSHVARMRRSRSSLWFAGLGVFMLALACTLIVLPTHGWERIMDYGDSYPDGYPQPAGRVWELTGKVPSPPGLGSGEPVLVRLWWNPGLWTMSIIINFVMVLLLAWFLIYWVTVWSNRALLPEYRGKKRFTAAIDYSTAHMPLLLLAACCYGSSLLHPLGRILQWDFQWPIFFHFAPAYLIGGFGLFVMWFWFLRMAHTAPPTTVGSISRYFGLWAPLAAIIIIGGWMVGQHYGIPLLAKGLGMNFWP